MIFNALRFFHYPGGIRPFVAECANIILLEQNLKDTESIVSAKHAIQPDRLKNTPKPLKASVINEKGMTISDEKDYVFRIIHLGKDSKHTEDYLRQYQTYPFLA